MLQLIKVENANKYFRRYDMKVEYILLNLPQLAPID